MDNADRNHVSESPMLLLMRIDVSKAWARDRLTPFGPASPTSPSGARGGRRTHRVAERALDGGRYRERSSGGTRALPKSLNEEARGRWWERVARCVLTKLSWGAYRLRGAPPPRRKVAACCCRLICRAVPVVALQPEERCC